MATRVLSIQSHVVFGYVGGKAAVFPLQCLGYDVDVVNTVHFSNHSGYGRLGGTKTTAAELTEIFQSMERNHLLLPDRLLTGYIPGAEGLSAVADLVKKLKTEKPHLIYLLDPVLGDSGRMYVAPDVIPIYRHMLVHSTVITPNWFEVELLTDVKIQDLPSLRRALTILHEEYHVPNVVISSIPLAEWLKALLPSSISSSLDGNSRYLLCIASAATSEATQTPAVVHTQSVELLPGYFSGVGDLFSALLLAHFTPDNALTSDSILARAVSQALTKTHAMLRLTYEHSETLPEEDRQPTDDEKDAADPLRKIRRMRGRELRLVQGQELLRGVGLSDIKEMVPWTEFWDSST
ncbi:Phos-pyr-kin domain-containing protein [Mycena indigotica]|uniref:pyridoxal kinase n=1 Tax=Mycena indigotica TaxID=2126181 RepID=A0A8H6WC95_9AGAR|nr:Phos-pyr-kin domain-containing protein [Mycena indigotica]KAF7309513.1 Phos-pyr-kin domain-containing protein [Mycena indigotica]